MSEIDYHKFSAAVKECGDAFRNGTAGEERLEELEVRFSECAKTIGAVGTDATDAKYTLWKVDDFRSAQEVLKYLGHTLEEFRKWAEPGRPESELLEGEQPCAEEQLEDCRNYIENLVKEFEDLVEKSSKAPKR